MPRPIKKRVLKKTETEEELKTEILSLPERIKGFISERKRFLILLLLPLLIASGFGIYSLQLNSKASRLFYEGYRAFYGPGDVINKAEAYRKGLDALKESYRLRPDPITLIYLADAYYRVGSLDDAIKSLQEFRSRFGSNRYLLPLCYQRLGLIYKKKGLNDEALKMYEELYKNGYTLRDLALYESIMILKGMNRAEEASKKAEILKKEFPDSPYLSMLKTEG